jgi:predicted O-methyltransferase YrrM/SAM-dependent methyltransferase
MKVNPHSTFVDATGQWLGPVQLSASGLLRFSTTRPILEALITILNQLEPDPYIAFMLRYYQAGLKKYGEHWSYADQLTVLHAAASLLQPENYLEIGVFRGRSMSVVASVAPNCRLWGFDLWVENYADLANPGPDFVRSQLKHVGYAKPVQLTSGNSLVTVPDFLKAHPDLYFDIITVDGDHSREGAVRDLQNVMPRLKIGGVLVFDDISHPLHPYLEQAWDETVAANSNFITAKFTEVGHGVALAIRRSEGSASVPLIEQTRQWNANEAELVSLRQQFEFSERDRADRLNVIQRQSEQFGQLQHEQFALHQQLNQTESERNALRLQLTDLQYRYEAAEADRAARLKVVEDQGQRLGELEGERNALRAELAQVKTELELLNRHWFVRAIKALRQPADPIPHPPPLAASSENYLMNHFYQAIREPKHAGGVDYQPGALDQITRELRQLKLDVQDYTIDVAGYRAYFQAADYKGRYSNYYTFALAEKSLEHYIATQLLKLQPKDVYIDIASEGSPVPEIYHRLYKCATYRQDLSYPAGLNGDIIGGDAANMPVSDAFASKMALHCSFEHFEGEADIRFIREIGRVLKPGGAVCFVPLYLFDRYAIQTDPKVSVPAGVQFEPDAVIYCHPTWANRHGRFYDPAHFMTRIYNNLNGLRVTLYRILNAQAVDPSCYAEFAMVISKPAEA